MRKNQGKRHQRPRRGRELIGALLTAALVGALAIASVLFLLRPNWPGAETGADAPSLPISVSGVVFNVPPAAIRIPVQRRTGAQPRLDLAFTWPDLAPPPPSSAKTEAAGPASVPDQVFITVRGPQGTVPLNKRVSEIYARYASSSAFAGPEGLLGVAFNDGTPYDGEDLLFQADRPENFVARCTRDTARTPGSCLLERHIGAAELTIRFRREWLGEWQSFASRIDRLLGSLHGPEG